MSLAPIRILVVDDEELLLRTTARTLKRAGYEVVTANGSVEALTELRDRPPIDIVVSDLEMPVMHGDALCREAQTIRPTPFILLSGNHTVLAERGAACGAAAVLEKPYTGEALKHEVETWANRREAEGA